MIEDFTCSCAEDTQLIGGGVVDVTRSKNQAFQLWHVQARCIDGASADVADGCLDGLAINQKCTFACGNACVDICSVNSMNFEGAISNLFCFKVLYRGGLKYSEQ